MENLIPLIVPALKAIGEVLWGIITFVFLLIEAILEAIVEVLCSIPPSGWVTILWLLMIGAAITTCYFGMTAL